MINLLSKQRKTVVKNILVMRFLNCLFVAIILSLVILILSLTPIYMHLERQVKDFENVKSNLNKDDNFNQVKNTSLAIVAANDKLKVFPNEMPATGYVQSVLDRVTGVKDPKIKIKSFRYSVAGKDPNSTNVEITGTAPTRKDLLDFKQKLESEKSFSNITLPISSFVRVENIEFSIRLRSQ